MRFFSRPKLVTFLKEVLQLNNVGDMKKIIFILSVVLTVISSCSKEQQINFEDTGNDEMAFNIKAMDNFSKILSEAVYESEEMREFLKNKALERFDNDYDVFYPFVKDEQVYDNMSFRDILLNYADSEMDLAEIEEALPLLNIYIPDFRWISDDLFSADTWKTSSSEISVINSMSNNIYGAGELLFHLDDESIPVSPILVVKHNERLRVSTSTKGGCSYSFISESFNGSIKTKASYSELYREFNTQPCDDYCAASLLNTDVIQAWNELGAITTASERDYVFYGMTQEDTVGVLNTRAKEQLLRFRIVPQAYNRIADNTSDDPVFWGETGVFKTDNPTDEFLLSKIWKEGDFEFQFDVYLGSKNGGTSSIPLTFSIAPSEIFQVSKVKYKYWNKTWVSPRKWQYDLNLITTNGSVDNLVSKWYYPTTNTTLVPWDLLNDSNNIVIYARELDPSITTSKTVNHVFKYANNVELDASFAIKKLSFGIGYTYNDESSQTESVTINYSEEDDELGAITLRYMDPVISGVRSNNGTTEYELCGISSGSIEMCFVPRIY